MKITTKVWAIRTKMTSVAIIQDKRYVQNVKKTFTGGAIGRELELEALPLAQRVVLRGAWLSGHCAQSLCYCTKCPHIKGQCTCTNFRSSVMWHKCMRQINKYLSVKYWQNIVAIHSTSNPLTIMPLEVRMCLCNSSRYSTRGHGKYVHKLKTVKFT